MYHIRVFDPEEGFVTKATVPFDNIYPSVYKMFPDSKVVWLDDFNEAEIIDENNLILAELFVVYTEDNHADS